MDDVGWKNSFPTALFLTASLFWGAASLEAKPTATPPKPTPPPKIKSDHPAKSAPPAKPERPHAASTHPAKPAEPVGQQIISTESVPPLASEGAILMDGLTGQILYEKNAYEVLYPASTTKILTALLVIEDGDLDREVVIQPEDTHVEPSAIGFKPGERYTRRELLYAMMLKSANDVAQALARDNAGSIEAFAEKMTKRAASLGALQSHFANPHGLPNADHYTTPYDLALIARAAMQQPLFRQIVGTVSYQWTTPRGTTELLKNHNKLLWCPPWKFEGCTGLKTGYTVKAGGVLVSSALRNHREVISVVMRVDKEGKWVESKALLAYGLAHLPEAPRF